MTRRNLDVNWEWALTHAQDIGLNQIEQDYCAYRLVGLNATLARKAIGKSKHTVWNYQRAIYFKVCEFILRNLEYAFSQDYPDSMFVDTYWDLMIDAFGKNNGPKYYPY